MSSFGLKSLFLLVMMLALVLAGAAWYHDRHDWSNAIMWSETDNDWLKREISNRERWLTSLIASSFYCVVFVFLPAFVLIKIIKKRSRKT